ncbi:MAG: acyl-CoA dehydrogenase family protein [Burkholderiales bacterium]
MVQASPVSASAEGLSDADRQLLRDSTRGFLSSRWPAETAVEQSTDANAIINMWQDVAAQGLSTLGADIEEGGLREITLVFEELGRAACPAPLLGAVMANLLLAPKRKSSKPAAALLDGIAEGKARVAAAFGPFDGDEAAGGVKLNGTNCKGRVGFLEDATVATHFLLMSDDPAGVLIVAADAPGVTVTETPGMARPSLAEVSFNKTPAALIKTSAAALNDAAMIARLSCASRALGAAQRTFELAVEHAKVRKQFDQLIGSFQAIQHKLANSLIQLEGSRLTIAQAAEARDLGAAEWKVFASAALAFAGPGLREVAVQNHRALGAIGYAEEHEAPRHFRRVHTDVGRFGGSTRARGELADYLLGRK